MIPFSPTSSSAPGGPPPGLFQGAPAVMRSGSIQTPFSPNPLNNVLDKAATRGRLPSPAQLLEQIKSPLSTLLTQQVRATTELDQIWKYAQVRRSNLYYRGKQNLTLTPPDAGTGMVDYRPVTGQSTLSPTDRSIEAAYDAVLNFYRGDVRAFDAVLGSRAPTTQAMQLDPQDDLQTKRKRLADRVAQYFDGHWNMNAFHTDLVHGLAVQGTQFSYVRYVSNPTLYGYTSIPRWESTLVPGGEAWFVCHGCGEETPVSLAQSLASPQTQGAPGCRRCGRPVLDMIQPDPVQALTQSTPLMYPNGAVECSLMGADRVTIPFWIKSLCQTPFLMLEEEVDPGALMQAYPKLREKLQGLLYPEYYGAGGGAGSGNVEQMGKYTRQVLASPNGIASSYRNSRVTHSSIWYQPYVYEYLPGDSTGLIRELLYKILPEGMKVQYCNGEAFDITNRSLTKNWAACKPEPSETLMGDPYFEDYIQASDVVNNFLNILLESGQRSIPLIIFDQDVINPQRLKNYSNLPGEYLPARAAPGGDLSKSFYKAPAAELNAGMFNFIDKFIGWVRDISGITPIIWGGGGPEPTARAAEIKKNQAMGRLNIVWNNIRRFHDETRENGAYQLAKWSDGRLFTSKGTPDSVHMIELPNIQDLLKGGWYYRTEEALPMTPSARRDWYMNLFQMATDNPVALQLSGLADPANLQRFQETVGSADWRTPGLVEREALMLWLGVMATLPPLPPPPPPPPTKDPMTGLMMPPPPPMPPQPNTPIPAEEIFIMMDPSKIVTITREFMVDRLEELQPTSLAMGGQGGWDNIVAFLRAAMQAAAPPPMPGPGGPGGPGGPPPPDGGPGDPDAGGEGPAPSNNSPIPPEGAPPNG